MIKDFRNWKLLESNIPESRVLEISEREFENFLISECSNYNPDHPSRMIRYSKHSKPWGIIRNGDRTRTDGRFHQAFINLLLRHFEPWKPYADRSKSVISLLTYHEDLPSSSIYGNELSLVIPFNGSKVSYCKIPDFWSQKFSLPDSDTKLYSSTFVGHLRDIIRSAYFQIHEETRAFTDTDFAEYIVSGEFDEHIRQNPGYNYYLKDSWKKNESLLQLIERIYTPENLEIINVNTNIMHWNDKIENINKYEYEIWTEGPVLIKSIKEDEKL